MKWRSNEGKYPRGKEKKCTARKRKQQGSRAEADRNDEGG
jgi:hypothetical protein